MQMAWVFDSSSPLYMQIADHIRSRIVCGVYAKQEKLPAVRELALEASVNPNTMQRAFTCLENEGLVITAGTMGRFVTDDDRVIQAAREKMASVLVGDFADKIMRLGYSLVEAAGLVEKHSISKEVNDNGKSDS